MKNQIKIIAIVFLVITIPLVFTSCFTASLPQSKQIVNDKTKKEKVTLRFINSWGGNDSKSDTLQLVLDKFMKENPDVVVKNESMFGDDFLPKLKTDFASGNNPDVFGLWPGSDIRALINADKVADLTDIIEKDKEWKNSFHKDMWSYTTFNDRIYGLPVEIIFECLFINRDLFDNNGIKVPETYDELKIAVQAFRERGIIPIAYNSFAEGTYLYQNIVAMLGGKEAVEHPYNDGHINPSYTDGMDYVKELYKMGAFPDNAFTLSSTERNNLFKYKKAAMIVQGSWFFGESEFKNANSKVDIIRFPSIAQGKAHQSSLIYGLGGGTFYMSKAAQIDLSKKEMSVKLLKALTSKETSTLFAEQTGMLSNVDIPSENINYSRLTKKGINLLNSAEELIGPPDSFIDRSYWEDTIVKQFPYVLEGKTTPREVWGEAIRFGSIKH